MDKDQQPQLGKNKPDGITRRTVVQGTAAFGLAVGAGGLVAACGGSSSTTGAAPAQTLTGDTTAAVGEPKRGGRLRVAQVGGGSAEGFTPGEAPDYASVARIANIFDGLCREAPKGGGELALAEQLTPNADASVWTIKLRQGVTWHDGKPLTVDEVIDSMHWWGRKESTAASTVNTVFALKGIKKIDDRTIELPLRQPIAELATTLTDSGMKVTRPDARDFSKPIGTGPFMFGSFVQGQSALLKRNPNYWMEGQPYVDELEIISMADSAARLNALKSGQVDAIATVAFTDAKSLESDQSVKLLVSNGPGFSDITMRVDLKPFSDIRVRTALKLAADRQAIVNAAISGFGQVANDLPCKGMKYYNDELPQREHDVEQAKSLLKQAGQENLQLSLRTSPADPGQLESATVYAEQAKAAGINIKLANVPAGQFYDDNYGKSPFSQDFWGPVPIERFFSRTLISTASYNVTHFSNPTFDKLVNAAIGEVDEAKAKTTWWDAQEIVWKEGGLLIWGYQPKIDGLSKKVQGAAPYFSFPLSSYQFREWWLA